MKIGWRPSLESLEVGASCPRACGRTRDQETPKTRKGRSWPHRRQHNSVSSESQALSGKVVLSPTGLPPVQPVTPDRQAQKSSESPIAVDDLPYDLHAIRPAPGTTGNAGTRGRLTVNKPNKPPASDTINKAPSQSHIVVGRARRSARARLGLRVATITIYTSQHPSPRRILLQLSMIAYSQDERFRE